jgi:hypothetical protein
MVVEYVQSTMSGGNMKVYLTGYGTGFTCDWSYHEVPVRAYLSRDEAKKAVARCLAAEEGIDLIYDKIGRENLPPSDWTEKGFEEFGLGEFNPELRRLRAIKDLAERKICYELDIEG